MKKILFVISLSLISLLTYSQVQGKTPPQWPGASSIASADLFLLWQSGALKNLPYSYLGAVLNDTADILRAEFPPLYRGEIHDTADVLRTEIADAATADTAWTYLDNYVFLKHIGDSVGIGTESPTEKLHVTGAIKATKADIDNGYGNIIVGSGAGVSLTSSGLSNTFVGYNAGNAVTSGNYNVLLGYQAGESLATYNKYVLIGYQAGQNVVGSIESVMIGNKAGNSVTTGNDNVFIGSLAGTNASTSSTYNVTIGSAAGYNSGASQSVFIGGLAGYNFDISGGVAIGYRAGYAAYGASGTTLIGFNAGENITTSDYHTQVGYQAGDAITTGSAGSSLFGYQAGTDATDALGFSAFGYLAGANVTEGDFNTFCGSQSGTAVTIGNYNSLFGNRSGLAISSGGYNTGIGNNALAATTTQKRNIGIGYQAGSAATASTCIYLGYQAGQNNTTDSTLHIDISNTVSPLIWGDFSADSIIINGDFRVTGYAGGATAWTDESDRRLKKNITPIESPLQKVLDLEGVQFEWKDQREPGQRIGLVAQDVEKVLPEVVKSGETYGIQYGPIVALLIEAVKEQQKEIDELKSQLKLKKTKNVKSKKI